MAHTTETMLELDGHEIRVTNRDKVLYPESGTTKGEVIDYFVAIAPHLVPLAAVRPVTRKRWVNGVGTADAPGKVFYQRDLDDTTPAWIPRATVHHKDHDNEYPLVDGPAVLAWLAQTATLELHVPQWRFDAEGAPGAPDRLVLDLDPGEGAGLPECVAVAKLIRAGLADEGFDELVPVTSGSKGIHLYAALDGSRGSDEIEGIARELARRLEADRPELVVSSQRKTDRRGRVLVDWSQNNAAKTTVVPYSLRGRSRPFVAMPRSWGELTSGRLRQIEFGEVLGLIGRRGDAAEALRPSWP